MQPRGEQVRSVEAVRGATYNSCMIAAAVPEHDPQRMLIVLPNWVGDLVLATPALEAIRRRYPRTHITGLLKYPLREVLAGGAWLDSREYYTSRRGNHIQRDGIVSIVRRLRQGEIDLAVLFPNSFRSALIALLAGARRRVGYARDGRSLMLTARLDPPREHGKYKLTPVMRYYNRLAAAVGAGDPPMLPMLHTTPDEEARVDRLLERCRVNEEAPLVVINPGAAFGPSKLWMPERFACVADSLTEQLGAAVFVSVGPGEEGIAKAIRRHLRREAHILVNDPQVGLGGLKALIRRAALLLTNDTGPRHFAIAFGVPVVTLFGSTAQEWTDTGYVKERKISVPVDCGPCQKPVCPLDHRCMTGIDADWITRECIQCIQQYSSSALPA